MYTPKETRVRPDKRPTLQGPNDVKKFMGSELIAMPQEHMFTLCLDTRFRVIEKTLVALGATEHVCVDLRAVFRRAIVLNASTIALVHNHPSGDPTPSDQDEMLTMRAQRAGFMLGINVVDHIVIAERGVKSIAATKAWQSADQLRKFVDLSEQRELPVIVPLSQMLAGLGSLGFGK